MYSVTDDSIGVTTERIGYDTMYSTLLSQDRCASCLVSKIRENPQNTNATVKSPTADSPAKSDFSRLS